MINIGLDQATISDYKKEAYLRPFFMLLIADIFWFFYMSFLGSQIRIQIILIFSLNLIILTWVSLVKRITNIKIDWSQKQMIIEYFNFFHSKKLKVVPFEELSFSYNNEQIDRFSRAWVLRIKKCHRKAFKITESDHYWDKELLDDLYNELRKMEGDA